MPTVSNAYLGIDVAKAKLDVCLLRDKGLAQSSKPKNCLVSNSPEGFEALIQWLNVQKVMDIHVCMEATAHYSNGVARFLVEKGYTVSVVNPASIRAFARCELARGKSDKADAGRIARYCSLHHPRPWTPPTQETETLIALVHRLDALAKMRLIELNRLESAPALIQASVQTIVRALETEISRIREQLKTFIEQTDSLRQKRELLLSIPGIGETTALILLAELTRAERLETARQAAAFAGLVPRIYESGSSVRGRSSLSKQGCDRLRKALYFPAMTAMRHNPLLRAFSERLLRAGKPKMVVLGAVMRKLLQMAFGVLKSGRKFDACLLPS